MPAAKPLSEHAARRHVDFRPDQDAKCQRLAKKRRLSGVCQRAVDEYDG